MKIDFDKDGMNLKLDKVPRLIYINESNDSNGGQVYIDGIRIKNLQRVKIHSKQHDTTPSYLEYDVQYYDNKKHQPMGIAQGFNNDLGSTTVNVKITDIDIFNELLDTLRLVTANEKVPMETREEFANKIKDILERD